MEGTTLGQLGEKIPSVKGSTTVYLQVWVLNKNTFKIQNYMNR